VEWFVTRAASEHGMVRNQGCIRAYWHINAYCNQQACLGKNACAICGTERSSNSPLSDRSSKQILKSGMGFKTWGLRTTIWICLCPQQDLLPTLFHVCVLGREGQSTQENPGGLQSWTFHKRQLFWLDPQTLVTLLDFVYFGVK